MSFLTILFQSIVTVAVIIALTRLHGVRSFSKMSGFDFAVTVAMGSVLASTIMAPDQSAWVGIGALVSLFAIQATIAQLRARDVLRGQLDNTPILIMQGVEVFDDNLKKAGMTRDDLYGKLREANAYGLDKVLAVIAESTGDVSVLHQSGGGNVIDPCLLENVRRS